MTIEYPGSFWKDYELLDSGCGEKLERFGAYVLARPEPKALWDKTMSAAEWAKLTHTRFSPGAGFAKAGKEDSGTWERLRKMDDQWYIRYRGAQSGLDFTLRLGLTSFKHVGVFPEQAPNWEFIYKETSALVAKGGPKPRVLNLVVTWARGNMERSGLQDIRWVVEDAMKFARRGARRGNRYQGIILDPPAYGHGPDGEKWKLDECLFDMLRTVSQILEPRDSFLVLNLYSNGYSPLLGETTLREAFSLKGDYQMESGELALRDRFGKALPLSIFVRLTR